MTLENLLRIGKLKPHAADKAEIERLVAAAGRSLRDADVVGLSSDSRLDLAYKAIMQSALVAMLAAGYRPSTSEPGHHQTMIQSLPLTLDAPNDVWVVLDAMRRQRNANDYTGNPITTDTANECIAQARSLRAKLHTHLAAQRPDLLKNSR